MTNKAKHPETRICSKSQNEYTMQLTTANTPAEHGVSRRGAQESGHDKLTDIRGGARIRTQPDTTCKSARQANPCTIGAGKSLSLLTSAARTPGERPAKARGRHRATARRAEGTRPHEAARRLRPQADRGHRRLRPASLGGRGTHRKLRLHPHRRTAREDGNRIALAGPDRGGSAGRWRPRRPA